MFMRRNNISRANMGHRNLLTISKVICSPPVYGIGLERLETSEVIWCVAPESRNQFSYRWYSSLDITEVVSANGGKGEVVESKAWGGGVWYAKLVLWWQIRAVCPNLPQIWYWGWLAMVREDHFLKDETKDWGLPSMLEDWGDEKEKFGGLKGDLGVDILGLGERRRVLLCNWRLLKLACTRLSWSTKLYFSRRAS